jgi:D-aspartate ligase
MSTLSTIPGAFADATPGERRDFPGVAPGARMGALVMGGAHGSLGVVRSLGRRGIPVWVPASNHPIAKVSRYAVRSFAWPGPDHADATDSLLALAERNGLRGWVLFPGGDSEARFIALHHAALASVYRVTTPPWETLRWASDKNLTYQLAAKIGVDCPWTFQPRSRIELLERVERFPVILKPKSRNSANAFTHAKAWRVDNAASLLARYDQAVELVGADSVMVQELIPGTGECQFSYAAVCDRGEPVAFLAANRRRQYPIDFGFTSTFVRSVDNPVVEEMAREFLRATNYSGMVELEFKYDTRDGKYKLLDVNARTWAWLSLGCKAGVDFPWTMWRLAMGEQVETCRGRSGCAWTHLSRDVAAAWAELRAGSLTLPEYFRSFRRSPVEFAALSGDDLLPGLLDLPVALSRFWRR